MLTLTQNVRASRRNGTPQPGSDGESPFRPLDRLLLARRPLGRLRLAMALGREQWRWRCAQGAGPVCKRALDLVGGVVVLLLASPFMALLALLIRLQDGGPAFLVQTRVGRHGTQFKLFKFRSMCVGADARIEEVLVWNKHQHGVTFKTARDPRLTRLGRWMRKLSLDELPQLINVVLGDMSLVGPRPPLPREVKLYSLRERRRLEVAPGLTCLWQISGRGDVDFPEQVELDVRYIETQSFWGDIKILLRTVPAVVSCRGAY